MVWSLREYFGSLKANGMENRRCISSEADISAKQPLEEKDTWLP